MDNPNPTAKQWRSRNYWIRVKGELYQAYDQICAYSCHWIPADTGATSFEHFHPKEKYPNQAYEWSNYRLVCGTLNGRKGTKEILDPFEIEDYWFEMEFPSLLVRPSQTLNKNEWESVSETIGILGLNDEATCWQSRFVYVREFCEQHVSFSFLKRKAPFIAREIERQQLVDNIGKVMNIA